MNLRMREDRSDTWEGKGFRDGIKRGQRQG